MTSRVIIEVANEIDPLVALRRVAIVIEKGRVSEAAGVKHYCWITKFEDELIVHTRRKRLKESADSFIVRYMWVGECVE